MRRLLTDARCPHRRANCARRRPPKLLFGFDSLKLGCGQVCSILYRVFTRSQWCSPTKTRPDEPLVPPAVCCGREFRVRRALEAHERSHGACGEAGCTFAGSRAALRLHAWEAHGIGSAPKTAPVRGGSTLHDELCAGRAGNNSRLSTSWPPRRCPLDVRFPGADIVWMHDAAEADALVPAEDAEATMSGRASPTATRLQCCRGRTAAASS
jgi:hypothetical protein